MAAAKEANMTTVKEAAAAKAAPRKTPESRGNIE